MSNLVCIFSESFCLLSFIFASKYRAKKYYCDILFLSVLESRQNMFWNFRMSEWMDNRYSVRQFRKVTTRDLNGQQADYGPLVGSPEVRGP